MYNIAKDSIFQPKELLNYRHKSGWFTTFYLLILALVVSLSPIIHYGWYKDNTVITTATSGCRLAQGGLVCDQTQYSPDNVFHLYGYSVHLLDESDSVTQIIDNMGQMSMVFQGESMTLFLDGERQTQMPIFSLASDTMTFDTFFQSLETGLLVGLLMVHYLGNLLLLLLVGLISTLPFIRLKRFIRYRIILKLVIFALTPVAILMSLYNLLSFPDIMFFVLLFIGYRSIYVMQRELHFQTMVHLEKQSHNIVDAEYEVKEEIDADQDDDEEKN
ncbi:MAG: hypothetical protein WC251_02115 [Candidatus Izemoplasmatales bacterium]